MNQLFKYPSNNRERAEIYLKVLYEIEGRLKFLEDAFDQPNYTPLLKREIAALQYRTICELIAISCLGAQGDDSKHKHLSKEYRPKIIFAALAKANPDFFPRCATLSSTEGRHHLDFPPNTDAITQSQVITLWAKSGDDLHRTGIKKFVGGQNELIDDSYLAPVKKFRALLNSHAVRLDGDSLLFARDLGGNKHETLFINVDKLNGTVSIEQFKGRLGSNLKQS